jgi:AraC-like DNA-binding protein
MDGFARLRNELLTHLDNNPSRRPLGGVGLFHSRAPQALHEVPLRQPTMVLILSGQKQLTLGSQQLTINSTQLLLAPAHTTVTLGNHPDPLSGNYLSLVVGFSDAAMDFFRRHYASTLKLHRTAPLWHAQAPAPLITALQQWCDWCRNQTPDPLLTMHRHAELLLLLARAGLAGNLLLSTAADWRQRVYELIMTNPAHDWRVSEISHRLGVGESTLRRRLATEQSGFREVLEDTRLVTALSLLQETFWPITHVAEAVGYQSSSRFSARFRERFGITPSALRRTRLSVSGQSESA